MKYLIILLTTVCIQSALCQDKYDEDFANKLVDIAWQNHPANKVVRKNVEVAKYNKKLAGAEWLNTITLTGNLNEFNIDPTRDIYNRSQFLPRYNLAANISLGVFFTIPYSRGKAKTELAISQDLVEEQRLTQKAMVLRLYNNFILQTRIFNLQKQTLNDTENNLSLIREQFSSGEVSFEAYSQAQDEYKSVQISYYEAEAAYKNAKVTLEEFIGVDLEQVE